MSLRQKYLKILTELIPAGAVGASLLLGATAASAATERTAQPVAAQPSVSERLAAIRDAVSTVVGPEQALQAKERQLAWLNWGWGGGGYGWPNWNNWRNWSNWGNYWRNW